MAIEGIYHVNVNCRDLERSRAFYESLGFERLLEFPEGGHPDMARGLGVGPHRVRGVLMRLGKSREAARLDLLQWQSPEPAIDQPAVAQDIGIVRLALWTWTFDEEVERLRGLHVDFVSEPISIETGAEPFRFVCFRDPDGNLLELIARLP